MKTTLPLPLFLVILLLTGCHKTDNTDPQTAVCQPPTTLVAQAPCESGYPGALLISSNYQGNSSGQLIYDIYVQKDTVSNDLTKSTYKNASNERIIISETILQNAPKFVVQVSINCNGKDRPSQFFPFVKRPTASSGCYVWALQKQ
ncbi:hypothetical protein [Spirosoma aerolatum]|uniref:hypothetical protein n=1 Tax=Spirosoma aerolatum TaxID=1211326 RepID=UPI0009ABB63D|nr:hypothetical protein [Spirosoma aerolatum]